MQHSVRYLDIGSGVPKDPEISIIIPAHGVNEFIVEAVESALGQKNCTAEVILIDDESNPPIKPELSTHHLEYIQLARISNSGIAAARNLGIGLARSDYICLLDGDDKISPDHCELALKSFSDDPELTVYVPDATLFGNPNQDGLLPGGQRPGSLLSSILPRSSPITLDAFLQGASPIIGCSVFSKPMLVSAGGFPENLRMAEDFFLHAQLLLRDAKYKYAERPTYWYRRHGVAMTTRDSITLCEWTLKALEQLSMLDGADNHATTIQAKIRLVSNELNIAKAKKLLKSRELSQAASFARKIDLNTISDRSQKLKWAFLKVGMKIFS